MRDRHVVYQDLTDQLEANRIEWLRTDEAMTPEERREWKASCIDGQKRAAELMKEYFDVQDAGPHWRSTNA
ncbi:MAG: hypothetical protein ACX939_13170 [Hyphococcus sp.]